MLASIAKSGDKKKITIHVGPQVKSSTGTVTRHQNQVDFIFVFDTTGSMASKIRSLKQACQKMVDETTKLHLDPQFALITFGDLEPPGSTDRIRTTVPLTGDIERMKAGLAEAPSNSGYGNNGESCFEAIMSALSLPLREKAITVMILITDEPAHQTRYRSQDVMSRLQAKEVIFFALATNNQHYKSLANKNGGYWESISASTNVAKILTMFKDIAKAAANTAKVIHLDHGGDVSSFKKLKSGK